QHLHSFPTRRSSDLPQLDQAWVATSDLYESLGNFEEALYYLNRALDLDGLNSDYWKRRAYIHIQLVRLEEAALDYYRMVELEPRSEEHTSELQSREN